METGLLQSFIQSFIEISPIGFIFGGIAMMYVKSSDAKNKNYVDAIDTKHKAHIETIEKHVSEIREDKGRYYQLVVEQGATLNEITAIVKRQAETIEQIVEIQQEQVDKLEKIESKIEWIDEHLSE